MIYTTKYHSPIGTITLLAKEKKLIGLYFENQKYSFKTQEQTKENSHLEVFKKTKDWLERYFNGLQPAIEELEIQIEGSEFRKQIWKLLCKIPYGEVTTYKKIAEQIAKEKGLKKMSAQAVGNAISHNPISILIPCHRVIGSNGQLTGYAGGIEKKKYLLELERNEKTDLLTIPYVGTKTKEDLQKIGITYVEDLKGKNPEELFKKDCKRKKYQEDLCQLYVFRLCVYFAENKVREEEKLKWWYWKDK